MSFLVDGAQAPDPRNLPDPVGPIDSSATWRRRDRIGLAFAWFAGLGFCVICGAIVVFLAVEGLSYLVTHPSMLWTNPTAGDTQSQTGGFLGPLIGTLLITTMAMVLATPIGVLALFGLLVFGTSAFGFLSQSNGGVVTGKSFLTATPLLTLLGLPLVVTTTREGLQAIPNHVREASYAVGKTKSATIRRVLLPAARPSVITGTMLSAAHVVGDTAIILLVLGDTSTSSPLHPGGSFGVLSGSGSTLTSYIFDSAPTGDLNQPQKAFAAALVLMALVLALNLIVDVFGNKARDLKWN